jgi:hypothetical protein
MRGSHAENQVATMKRTKSVSKRPRFRDSIYKAAMLFACYYSMLSRTFS